MEEFLDEDPMFHQYAMYTVGKFPKLGSHFGYPYILGAAIESVARRGP